MDTPSRKPGAPPEWGYIGDIGPAHWGCIHDDYSACGEGRAQSPVDLDLGAAAVADFECVFDYQPTPLAVVNTGKTVQANCAAASHMTAGGKRFKLVQVHFHTPGEHTFSGKTYPMEAHFVHADDNDALAVFGVMFEAGAANPELEKIIAAVYGKAGGNELNPSGMLPNKPQVCHYTGSLTTPPCTEGVRWYVAANTMTASEEQLRNLREIMGRNARPIMPLHGRRVVKSG